MDLLACHEVLTPASVHTQETFYADVDDILANLYVRERRNMPLSDYVVRVQTHGMKRSWRSQVYDWLVSIANTADFEPLTVALAINYLDRYLSVVSIKQSELELLALVCMLCASKFNEKDCLSVAEVGQMVDSKYTASQVAAVERALMKTLGWNLHVITPQHFLDSWIALMDPSSAAEVSVLCAKILPKVSRDVTSLKFAPSEIAYSVLSLALQQLQLSACTPTYAGTSDRLVECEEIVEVILQGKASNGAQRPKPSKRAASPTNVEDFDAATSPARQRPRRASS
ncbi:hypothetical protein LEN26_014368 [Aphanomyces euteiches]|nr:hypothetical protein LEN26_014368 [Aphanomyces euteiches]KAH9108388.1 hypothetical protein AeMF1_016438 [Aphanomyces euteiches]KAH9182842.1 hypothetical protein AeNC1_015181 [Aphanomyces euteiches]